MRMVDLGNQKGPLHLIGTMSTATSVVVDVDCTKDVRLRRSFRSLMECMVPCCGFQPTSTPDAFSTYSSDSSSSSPSSSTSFSTSTVTGTFFGHRKGRVSFCLQDDSRASPFLLLEFAVPTAYLAREMQHGLLRIALECKRSGSATSGSLFAVPVWCMYCNGRKVGFALRRQSMSKSDAEVLGLMQSISVGAGVLPVPTLHAQQQQVVGHHHIQHQRDQNENQNQESMAGHDQLLYLRANFQRVTGSVDSESFHMINPLGSCAQELSIFFLRS